MFQQPFRFMAVLLVWALTVTGCADTGSKEHSNHEHHGQAGEGSSAGSNLSTLNTKNVTRVAQKDPIKVAVEVSQMVWPATMKENRPGTVLLGQKGKWEANLAAATLIHHPNNGPLLYAEPDGIPGETMQEIQRLQPLGSRQNQGVQIILIGDFRDEVLARLEKEGFKVDAVTGKDPAELAAKLDQYYADAGGGLPQNVIVGSVESPDYTLPAANWIAHMPEPLLYVNKDGIPGSTREALKKRKNKANIYLLGPEEAVSAKVEKELKEYGIVRRISGKNPEENAIRFARYQDEKTGFGWGIDQPGHGFTINRLSNVDAAIAGAAFAHLGKHAPMLLMESEKASDPLHEYLMSLQPTFRDDPTVGPYNHAYLIGTERDIPFSTQGLIDQMLEIVPKEGGGHNGHGGH